MLQRIFYICVLSYLTHKYGKGFISYVQTLMPDTIHHGMACNNGTQKELVIDRKRRSQGDIDHDTNTSSCDHWCLMCRSQSLAWLRLRGTLWCGCSGSAKLPTNVKDKKVAENMIEQWHGWISGSVNKSFLQILNHCLKSEGGRH